MADATLAPPRSSEPSLALRDFTYSYPNSAAPSLRGIDLEIGAGEFVIVAGLSASGKSTLLRAGCGLIPHFHGGEVSGEVSIAGHDLRHCGPGEVAVKVGYVAQDAEAHVVSSTVRGEIELPLELRRVSDAARARAVEEVSLALGIPHLLGRTTDSLSGGELQRVALAAALVTRPGLVLLDEPTSQLDPIAGDELIGLLRRLNEEWGMTVVLCEHRLERCLSSADRVVVLENGSIGFDGVPARMLAWASQNSRSLLTPGAQMFAALVECESVSAIGSEIGSPELPVGVKQIRQALRASDLLDRLESGDASRAGRAADLPSPSDPESGSRAGGLVLSIEGLELSLTRDDRVHQVLRGINLEIEPGSRVALMGRNGAGKSTLLRCIAGLVEPERGRIRRPAEVALLGQRAEEFLIMESLEQELPGRLGAEALEKVGLAAHRADDPRELSGGQRQRAALAVAMAGREFTGSLICLDEPTRGLDRGDKLALIEMANEWAEQGAAVIICTHDVEFAAGFADRVVLMGEGEVVADGPAEDVLAGGWYFATEIARILGVAGVVSPEQGAAYLRGGAA